MNTEPSLDWVYRAVFGETQADYQQRLSAEPVASDPAPEVPPDD